jgi:hypothetical protein
MGARVSVAEDQRPIARIDHLVGEVDESGREVLKRIPSEPGLIVSVLHFVDLDDARRCASSSSRRRCVRRRPGRWPTRADARSDPLWIPT